MLRFTLKAFKCSQKVILQDQDQGMEPTVYTTGGGCATGQIQLACGTRLHPLHIMRKLGTKKLSKETLATGLKRNVKPWR